MRSRCIVSSLLVSSLCAATASGEGARLLRQPSPGGDQVVFAYANDIWIVGKDGGEARRLTTFRGTEAEPRLSPDGAHVAFTGQYEGNVDVYVVPVAGGPPRRMTFHPGPDTVRGWTPDGSAVLFASTRDRAPIPYTRFWTIGLDDAMPEALPVPRAWQGALEPGGTRLAYQPIELWDVEWYGYRGGQARPIWLLDLESHDLTKLPWSGSRDTDPVWLDGMVYFLSDREGSANVYRYNPANASLKAITRHTEFDAKDLQAGGGILVYELAGRIRSYEPETDDDRALEITLRGDFPWKRPHWENVGGQLTSGSLSPTGKRAVFEARGEILTVPAEKGDVRNLTRSPEAGDRFPAWSPDGKHIAWFSDDTGEYRMMIGKQDGLETPRAIEIPDPTFFYAPSWSPDSKKILFTDEERQIHVLDVEAGAVTRIDGDTYAVPGRSLDPVWSPCSKWIAYAKRLDSQLRAIMLYSLEAGEAHQLTDGMSDATNPAFDTNGKYLYFLASTNAGLTTGWLDMSAFDRTVTRGAYLVVLRDDVASPFVPESDEEEVVEEDEDGEGDEDEDEDGDGDADGDADEDGDEGGDAGADADGDEDGDGDGDGDADGDADEDEDGDADAGADAGEDDEDEDEDESEATRIDFEGIDQRILALPVPERNYTALVAGAEGIVFMTEASYALGAPGLTLHRFALSDREAKPFMSGIFTFSLSHDGQKLLYGGPGTWGIVPSAGQASVGQGRLSTGNLRVKIDPPAEWRQVFREAWRLHRDYFYVDNLHGADWDAVYERWEPLLEHVAHRSDLTYLMDVMAGEIAVGHSFTAGGDTPDVESVPVGLLGADYEVAHGRYRIAKILRGENWNPQLRSPLSQPGLDVSEGDYILAVDGYEIDDTMNIYGAFEGTAGRQVTLHINDEPTMDEARTITVVPVGGEMFLRQREWMEANRAYVDEASGGRLAYVWLPDTTVGGFTNLNRYYFAQQDREGAVIDERFNGGGSAADYMVDIMARRLHGYFNNPIGERRPFTTPGAGIWGPKVMVINESAGSGGDFLPYLFRAMEIGPLIGTRTWGGLVGIWDFPPLIDGGVITVPRGGFFDLEGVWDVENVGVAPDIEVEMDPGAVMKGHDPQLERAVAEALRLLEEGDFPQLIDEPDPPVRARREGEEVGGGGVRVQAKTSDPSIASSTSSSSSSFPS